MLNNIVNKAPASLSVGKNVSWFAPLHKRIRDGISHLDNHTPMLSMLDKHEIMWLFGWNTQHAFRISTELSQIMLTDQWAQRSFIHLII